MTNATDCFAFPDANVALHYDTFDNHDWLQMLGADRVQVACSLTLFDELGKNRSGGTRLELRERARARMTWLTRKWKSEDRTLRPGVALRFLDKPHGLNLLAEGLRPESGDDNHIAEVIASKRANPAVRHVLITDDVGLTVRAAAFSIETKEPDESQYQPVTDESDRELRRLREENERLRTRRAELDLRFAAAGTKLEVSLSPFRAPDETEINERIHEAAEKNPRFEAADGPAWLEPTPNEYNLRRGRYLNELREYLQTPWNHRISIPLKLELFNDGTLPAHEVSLTVTFPRGLDVHPSDPTGRDMPRPPNRPRPSLLSDPYENLFDPMRRFRDPALQFRGPEFDAADGQMTVEWHAKTLKHQHFWSLDNLYISFESFSAARSFGFHFSAYTVDLPGAVDGSLNVVIKKQEGNDTEP